MLIEFARILERNLIADGIAVRFGGEEFMLILPDVTEEEIRHMLAKMSADYRLFGKQKKEPGIYIQLWCGTVCRRYGCFGRLPAGG